MTSSTAERRNGTAVAFPIRTAEIALDEIGYAGWHATVRLNPRSSVYDQLVSFEDNWWAAFGQIVLDWNFPQRAGRAVAVAECGRVREGARPARGGDDVPVHALPRGSAGGRGSPKRTRRQLLRYLQDQRRKPEARVGVAPPNDYLPILLAERFGGGPFLYRDVPADEREHLLRLLGIEGRVARAYEGLGPDDEFMGDLAEDDED